MFEVGFIEILLISILALVVLGPEKLPKVARQVGHWMGRARAMARQFREQLDEEAIFEESAKRPNTSSAPNYSASGSTAQATMNPAPAASPAPAATPAPTTPASASVEEDESSYYPPDHHANPNYQSPDAPQPAQSDWVSPSDTPPKP